MQKYFNIYWAGQPTVLLNASEIQSIDQTSTTTTVLGYSSRAAADKVTLTHLADASGVAVQNFFLLFSKQTFKLICVYTKRMEKS